jgi:hypothetical protein
MAIMSPQEPHRLDNETPPKRPGHKKTWVLVASVVYAAILVGGYGSDSTVIRISSAVIIIASAVVAGIIFGEQDKEYWM